MLGRAREPHVLAELLPARVTALSKAASSPSICNPDVYYLLENFYGVARVKISVVAQIQIIQVQKVL